MELPAADNLLGHISQKAYTLPQSHLKDFESLPDQFP